MCIVPEYRAFSCRSQARSVETETLVMKKIIVSTLILAATCTSIVVPAGEAAAQQWD
jgi:hypothetical protein